MSTNPNNVQTLLVAIYLIISKIMATALYLDGVTKIKTKITVEREKRNFEIQVKKLLAITSYVKL